MVNNLFTLAWIWRVFLQFSSKLLKFFFEKLRMIEIGPRGRWKRSSIFQMSHPSKKSMHPKANEQRKKKTICEIFHQKKIQKVLMKIEEMADVFLNSANFASHAFLTLAPPSGYALNLKALIKVSKVSWTSQLSYEILRSSFERKFDKTNFISPKRTPPKSPHQIGLNQHFNLKNQRNWIKQVLMLSFLIGIICILLHRPKKLTLAGNSQTAPTIFFKFSGYVFLRISLRTHKPQLPSHFWPILFLV